MRQILASLLLGLAACAGQATVAATTPPPPADPAPAPAPDPAPVADEPAPVVQQTLKSLEVSSEGIRLKKGLTIKFKTDSDQMLAESSPILDEVASVMSQNDKIHIRVEGHTDNAGDKNHNQDLSTRRAGAVKAYLASKGIAADRLDSVGCGPGTPIADNGTEAGRAENRRVEFVIISHHHPRGNCELYKPHEHHDHDSGKDSGLPTGGGGKP